MMHLDDRGHMERELGFSHAERAARWNDRQQRVVSLWPAMSVRDIARELDIPVSTTLRMATMAGLPSRPTALEPEEARRTQYRPFTRPYSLSLHRAITRRPVNG